jgi:hypothetical protein
VGEGGEQLFFVGSTLQLPAAERDECNQADYQQQPSQE